MYKLIWSGHFTRSAKKFTKLHPELKKKLAQIFRDLEKDPFQPHLELHSLGGKMKDIQAVSLTHSFRITLTVIITDKEVVLLDIGSHDEVYR